MEQSAKAQAMSDAKFGITVFTTRLWWLVKRVRGKLQSDYANQ